VFLRSFQEGALNLSAFEEDQYLDPAAREIMSRISVRVDDELEAEFPKVIIMRASATTVDGQTHSVEIVNPKGHEDNPVTDVEVAEKFRRLVEPTFGPTRTETALTAWRAVATAKTVSEVLDVLVLDDTAP
jgi:2-methylcitrate dehydratase